MRLLNRDAPSTYSIVGGGVAVATVAALLTPQRWAFLACGTIVGLLLLRYLIPASATIEADGVTFRWPLRTVTLTPATLVTARVLGSRSMTVLGLRRIRSVRFGVRVGRYENPALLAAALIATVRTAQALQSRDRCDTLTYLRSFIDSGPSL